MTAPLLKGLANFRVVGNQKASTNGVGGSVRGTLNLEHPVRAPRRARDGKLAGESSLPI